MELPLETRMAKRARDLMTRKSVRVSMDDRIYKVIEKVAHDKETMLGCVIDEQGKLLGLITPRELLKVVEVRGLEPSHYSPFEGPEVLGLLTSRYARDIMSAPVSVREDSKISEAVDIMVDRGFYEVPVVDKENNILGEVNLFNIIESTISYLKRPGP
jgi:CBS domain-containing protein